MTPSERAIERLLYEYAECVDRADYAGVGRLFARGEIAAGGDGPPLRGADAVEKLYAATNRRHEDGTARTLHAVTNVMVDVDGDGRSARARSRYVVYQATPELPLQPIVAGRYEDEFARDDEGWYFTRRRIHVDLVGDVSQHLTLALRPTRTPVAGGAGAGGRGPLGGWRLVGWAALALGLMELAILAAAGTGEEGVRMGIRATARTSLLLFSLAFAASSLRRVWRSPVSAWLLRNRRYLGVSFAVSHLYHALGILAFRVGWPEAFARDVAFSTVVTGGIGYLFIAAMTATSSDRAARRLGRRRWRQLHWTGSWVIWWVFFAVYGPAAAAHWLPVPFALLLLATAGLRVYVRLAARRRPGAATAALALCLAAAAGGDASAESALRLRMPTERDTPPARVYDARGDPVGHSRTELERFGGRTHVRVQTFLDSGVRTELAMGLEPLPDGRARPVWQRTRSYEAGGELSVEALIDHGRARATCREDDDLRVMTLPEDDRLANVPLALLLDPLADGSVDEVRFEFLFCRGLARIFDARARRSGVRSLDGYREVAEIEVEFDLGTVLSFLLRPLLPTVRIWLADDHPARWVGHRMPLVPRGPPLWVMREGVSPAPLQAP